MPEELKPFKSMAEVIAAMSDRRYSDPLSGHAYVAEVEARMAISGDLEGVTARVIDGTVRATAGAPSSGDGVSRKLSYRVSDEEAKLTQDVVMLRQDFERMGGTILRDPTTGEEQFIEPREFDPYDPFASVKIPTGPASSRKSVVVEPFQSESEFLQAMQARDALGRRRYDNDAEYRQQIEARVQVGGVPGTTARVTQGVVRASVEG
jgi:hypothetical protein